MSKKHDIIRAIVVAVAICSAFILISYYLDWRKRQPTPEHITRLRIQQLEMLCHRYHKATGSYPPEQSWSRSLVEILIVDDNWIDNSDFRVVIDDFYDAWGYPMRYRFPGIRNPQGYDIYSIGPDGHDDGGENDDIGNWSMEQLPF
jgi:hypothetical protein